MLSLVVLESFSHLVAASPAERSLPIGVGADSDHLEGTVLGSQLLQHRRVRIQSREQARASAGADVRERLLRRRRVHLWLGFGFDPGVDGVGGGCGFGRQLLRVPPTRREDEQRLRPTHEPELCDERLVGWQLVFTVDDAESDEASEGAEALVEGRVDAEGPWQVLPTEWQPRVALEQPGITAEEHLLEPCGVGGVDGLDAGWQARLPVPVGEAHVCARQVDAVRQHRHRNRLQEGARPPHDGRSTLGCTRSRAFKPPGLTPIFL